MITPELKQFIEGPQGMSIGTRDSKLIPDYNRTLGAWVTEQGSIKIHIAKQTADRVLANLEDNGSIALTMAGPTTFECYQVKGKAVDWHDSTEEDKEHLEHYLKIFDLEVQNIGAAAGLISTWPADPTIVIEIQIQEIFDQTPKVGAGNPIKQ